MDNLEDLIDKTSDLKTYAKAIIYRKGLISDWENVSESKELIKEYENKCLELIDDIKERFNLILNK